MNPAHKRFLIYSSIGVSTFLFDLALLWVAIDVLSISYLIATPLAFLVAVSINYFISRKVVFRGTERTLGRGYLYFIILAGAGMAGTTLLMWALIELTGFHFAVIRVVIAGIIGIFTYLTNLYLNFKVVGVH